MGTPIHVAIEHAIPSLVLQQSRDSRSPFHTIWREEDYGTGSLVMAHVDNTPSHCVVLTDWSEMH